MDDYVYLEKNIYLEELWNNVLLAKYSNKTLLVINKILL